MLEREYNVPLRREFLKSPRYKRTNRAVSALKAFISKHMKSDDVSVGRHLNNKLWENGIKNPPHKVTVLATKDDSGKVTVELKDIPELRPKVNKRLARVVKSEGKESDEKASDEKKKTGDKEEKKSDDSMKGSEKSVEKPVADSPKKPEKPKEPVTGEKKSGSTEKGDSRKSAGSKSKTDSSTKKEEKKTDNKKSSEKSEKNK